MYAMISTRPDIAFVVGKLSRYTSNPSAQHWQALARVFQYLKGTMNYGLTYSGYPSIIEGRSRRRGGPAAEGNQLRKGRSPAAKEKESSCGRRRVQPRKEMVQPRKGKGPTAEGRDGRGGPAAEGKESSCGRGRVQPRKEKGPAAKRKEVQPRKGDSLAHSGLYEDSVNGAHKSHFIDGPKDPLPKQLEKKQSGKTKPAVVYNCRYRHWRFDLEGLLADLVRRGMAVSGLSQRHGLKVSPTYADMREYTWAAQDHTVEWSKYNITYMEPPPAFVMVTYGTYDVISQKWRA
nr:zinc finger, CCHC-type [Tanacetum cinerariifolium]